MGQTPTSGLPYRDPNLPVEHRVEDLLARMTLEEKIGQLAANYLDSVLDDGKFSQEKMEEVVQKLGIGALHSFRWHVNKDTPLQMLVWNQAQEYLVENTRLGIPAILTGEGVHGHLSYGATIFPHAIALASTRDPELVHEVATVVAKESRAAGVSQILSPVFDLAREPRWGRCQETYGEDQHLASRMGVAFIKGLQGRGPAIDIEHVAATAKHFAAHGSPEAGINIAPVRTGERQLRDTYLPPFEAAVREAGVLSVMPAYHEIDGIPCACSKFLLTKVLREEWGFKGYTYSDWESVKMLHNFHLTAHSQAEAGKQALEAGMDIEAPEPICYGRNLLELVESGEVAIATVDEAVRRVLRVKFLIGLFENPYCDPDYAKKIRNCAPHRALARKVARESATLLKNEGGLLPLRKDLPSIAIIGPNADAVRLGDYSGTNDNLVTLLKGIKAAVSPGTTVRHAQGCGVFELDTSGIAEAVEIARESDVVVLALGESNEICYEGVDQTDLELPGVQMELVKAVCATGKPVAAVLMNGRPLSISWMAENVPAILEVWYAGEEAGSGIADVLFGDFNPCGKLPVSIPRSVGHVPSYYDHKPSARGIYHKPGEPGKPGNDYVFSPPTPLYEFGHGLSYTTFEYSDLRVEPGEIRPGGEVTASITVRNTGSRAGSEVVHFYLTDLVSTVTTPVKCLKHFHKLHLDPGESQVVSFTLKPADLALLDRNMEWVVEPGEFEVAVGGLTARFVVSSAQTSSC